MVDSDHADLVGAAGTILELVIDEEVRKRKPLLKNWLSLPLALRSNMGDRRARAIDLKTVSGDHIAPLVRNMMGDLVGTVLRKASTRDCARWFEKPLECAVRSNNLDLVTLLLAVDGLARLVGGLRYCEMKPSTLLHMAVTSAAVHCTAGNPAIMAALLNNGALVDINRRVWALYTDVVSWNSMEEVFQAPLHRTVFYGFLHMTVALVEVGASVNVFDSAGFTPLSIAIDQGRGGIARYLLRCGASPNTKTRRGVPVLHLAMTTLASFELVPLMLTAGGVDVNATNESRQNALHVACATGVPTRLIERIVIAGADVNARDEKNGDTPLMMACRRCTAKAVAYLLWHGADDTLTNRHGLEAGAEVSSPRGE